MNTTGLVLVIPEKGDLERDAVAKAWESAGGTVLRLGRFWDPPELDPQQVRVYGNDTFCLVLQQKLGLDLCSPDDDLLARVPGAFLRRKVELRHLREIDTLVFPKFVKTIVPKQVRSRVYASAAELRDEATGLDPDTLVLVSDPVHFVAELRLFVLDGQVLDAAFYEGEGDRAAGVAFGTALLPHVKTPHAVVVDVGRLPDGEWALIELNAAWGAGLNGCSAVCVLPAIAQASGSFSASKETSPSSARCVPD